MQHEGENRQTEEYEKTKCREENNWKNKYEHYINGEITEKFDNPKYTKNNGKNKSECDMKGDIKSREEITNKRERGIQMKKLYMKVMSNRK